MRQGFSLLELAVVLAILGVVAVLGMDIGNSALRGSDRVGTQEKLRIIQQALDGYAQRNGYLPCPADPAMLPNNASFGIESRNSTAGLGCSTGGGVTSAGNAFYGMVPVRNLGLNDSFAADSWSNKFLYAVSNQHVGSSSSGLNSYYANTPTLSIATGTRTTNYTISTLNTGVPGAGATYVALSHGANGRGAYPLNGTAVAIACGASATFIDVENCDRSNSVFFASNFSEGAQAATQFDDYIVWGSNSILRNPSTVVTNSCASSCELWCAPCTVNAGGTLGASPPASGTRICQKFITSTSPCQATCVWPSATMPCP